MDKKTRIFGVVLSLGFMLLSFNHCVVKQKTASKANTGTSESTSTANAPENNLPDPIIDITPPPDSVATPSPSEPAPPPEVIRAQQIDVGVKNFEQINATMSVVTGVDAGTNAIRRTFSDIEVQLPSGNNVKSFLAANQVAITKLAAEYCDQLVNNSTLRSRIWPSFNFGGTPSTVLANNVQKSQVINDTLDAFWGVNVGSSRITSQAEMRSLIDALMAGEPNDGNTTRTTMKGICTAALASAQVTLM